MTLFEALTGVAFDCLNWQHSGEFDQNFSKKSNAPGFAQGRGWAVLELTGTLRLFASLFQKRSCISSAWHSFPRDRIVSCPRGGFLKTIYLWGGMFCFLLFCHSC